MRAVMAKAVESDGRRPNDWFMGDPLVSNPVMEILVDRDILDQD
jgi:hypothetical protein